jgi:hypothetical protein
VDPKEQKELKESWMMMKSRDIPVAHGSRLQVAQGWGGSRMRRGVVRGAHVSEGMSFGPMMPMMSMPMSMSNRAPMMKSMMRSQSSQSGNPVFSLDDPVLNGIEMESLCRNAPADESLSFLGGSTHRNQPQENTDDDKLMKLVSSQNFDGSFKLETSIAQLLDTTTDDITQGIFSHFSLTNKIQY